MTPKLPLRVLVVDDEPIARRRLARMLRAFDDVEIAGEAADVASAIKAVATQTPDLMLLDIQMPGGSGFDVVESLGAAAPLTIFVTAFDHHALRAFEVAAADYLTKPVDPPRLALALQRARRTLEERSQNEEVRDLLATVDTLRQSLRDLQNPQQTFWVKSRGTQVRLSVNAIDYISAERDYVHLFSNGQSYLVSESMASISARLSAHGFLRIHRSLMVRIEAVESVQRGNYGKWFLTLRSGEKLGVGRHYAPATRHALNLTPSDPVS